MSRKRAEDKLKSLMYHDDVLRAGGRLVVRLNSAVTLVFQLDRYIPTEGVLDSYFQRGLACFLYVDGEVGRLVADYTDRLNSRSVNFDLKLTRH